jgi:lipoic acid synthetase
MNEKPKWLKIRYSNTSNREEVEKIIENLELNTVCKEANCPNFMECFSNKTATFMILGTNCTRNCRFCNVRYDNPSPLNPYEPQNVADAVKKLRLQYVVVTSVTRDDLPDGGAQHFAEVIRAIKKTSPQTAVEVLVPDFQGNIES